MLDRAPDQRLLKGAAATLRAPLLDQDGEVDTSVTSGVTVTVTRLDGTAVATAQAATIETNGVATYTLTAAQTAEGLDVLTAVWTHSAAVRATTYHEVVGRHWFAPSALREIAGVAEAQDTPPGNNANQVLIDARTRIESLIEWATRVAWVPRTELEYLDGCSDALLLSRWYPRTLRSLTIDGTAQTVADFTLYPSGVVRRDSGGPIHTATSRGAVVRYDHGADAPPEPLRRAALQAAAYDLLRERTSTISARATGFSGQAGTISFAAIDPEHPTGIPEVDGIILAYRKRRPGIA